MPRNNTAAAPIAMPAIAPADRLDEDDAWVGAATGVDEIAVEIVGSGGMDVLEEPAEVDEADPGAAVLEAVLLLDPFGPRSTYASQSELGTASGQLLA